MKAITFTLKTGFFEHLSQRLNVNKNDIDKLWDEYLLVEEKCLSTEYEHSISINSVQSNQSSNQSSTSKKTRKLSIARELQTVVDIKDLSKFKVTELKKINQERGITSSGNRASLIEALIKYETNYNENRKNQKIESVIVSKKNVKPVLEKQEFNKEYETTVDSFGNLLIDDLVISEEFNEPKVVGFIDEINDVNPLDREHIEKCKDLGLPYMVNDFD